MQKKPRLKQFGDHHFRHYQQPARHRPRVVPVMVAQNSQSWCPRKKSAFSHQPCLAPRSALSEASEAHGKTEGKSASLPFGRCGVPRHASARDAARRGCRALREVIAHLCFRLRLHHEAAGVRVPSRAASLGHLPHLRKGERQCATLTMPRAVSVSADSSYPSGCAVL